MPAAATAKTAAFSATTTAEATAAAATEAATTPTALRPLGAAASAPLGGRRRTGGQGQVIEPREPQLRDFLADEALDVVDQSSAFSGVTRVKASPTAWARPVRPMRCT